MNSLNEDILTNYQVYPTLRVGQWIIVTKNDAFWGIDDITFETKDAAEKEAERDSYLQKAIKQLTSANIEYYQKRLQAQREGVMELIDSKYKRLKVTNAYDEIAWYSKLIGKEFDILEINENGTAKVKRGNGRYSYWVGVQDYKLI